MKFFAIAEMFAFMNSGAKPWRGWSRECQAIEPFGLELREIYFYKKGVPEISLIEWQKMANNVGATCQESENGYVVYDMPFFVEKRFFLKGRQVGSSCGSVYCLSGPKYDKIDTTGWGDTQPSWNEELKNVYTVKGLEYIPPMIGNWEVFAEYFGWTEKRSQRIRQARECGHMFNVLLDVCGVNTADFANMDWAQKIYSGFFPIFREENQFESNQKGWSTRLENGLMLFPERGVKPQTGLYFIKKNMGKFAFIRPAKEGEVKIKLSSGGPD